MTRLENLSKAPKKETRNGMSGSEGSPFRQPINQKIEAIRTLNQVEDQQPVGADWRAALVTICSLLTDVKIYIVGVKDESQ